MNDPRPRERTTLTDAVLELARSQLGVRESGGPNDGVPSERYAGGRREPWCAHFIAWLYRTCGAPLPGDVEPDALAENPLASVAELDRMLTRAGWLTIGPARGHVVLFGAEGGPRHCGVIERVSIGGVTTIEGNAGDEVRRVFYRRPTLDGRHPRYASVPEPYGWRAPESWREPNA